MTAFKIYENGAKGIRATISSPEIPVSANMVMITQSSSNVAVPYFFVQSYANEKPYSFNEKNKEALEEAFLKEIASSNSELITDDLKEWVQDVLDNVDVIERSMYNSMADNFVVGDETTDELVLITPCAYNFNGSKSKLTKKDVEYYLTDSPIVKSTDSIYELAASFSNYEQIEQCYNVDKQKLQSFYEEKVMPVEDIPYNDQTSEQREIMGMFSDWHKEIYGRRPHNENFCRKNVEQKTQHNISRKEITERE